jgi:tRNA pseudouridine38-40 synthase
MTSQHEPHLPGPLDSPGTSGRERNIRLTLSYDGTDFSGWQRQKNGRSVQEELEKALATMHGHEVPVAGSGRTDAGVHARAQAAGFTTDIASIPAERFTQALNALLPRDVRILRTEAAPPGHHVRFDARLRRYRYFLRCGNCEAWQLRYAAQIFHRPDIRILNAMAAVILGENDFTTFCSARDPSQSRCRYIFESAFFWEGESLVYQIAGNAFLLRMVRSLVGSMLDYSRTASDPAQAATKMRQALLSKNRHAAGATAVPQGLFLWSVEFFEQAGMRDLSLYRSLDSGGRLPSCPPDRI